MNIDFGRPFTYVFEDQDWMKKILIGGLYAFGAILCFVGIFALIGYQKRIIAQVADGRDVPLPEFDRFGEDLVEGLKIFVIFLVYLLPSILIQMCSGVANGILGGQGGDAQDVAALISVGAVCLYLPLQLIGTFLAPVGVIRFVNSGNLGDAFAFGEVIGFVRNQFVNVLLVFVIGMAANIVASFSILLLCIGIVFGIAWYNMAIGHARGQLLRLARQSGALPAPAA